MRLIRRRDLPLSTPLVVTVRFGEV